MLFPVYRVNDGKINDKWSLLGKVHAVSTTFLGGKCNWQILAAGDPMTLLLGS